MRKNTDSFNGFTPKNTTHHVVFVEFTVQQQGWVNLSCKTTILAKAIFWDWIRTYIYKPTK